MNRLIPFLIFSVIFLAFVSAHKPAYQVFTHDGKKTDFGKIITQAEKADVVLFGEKHNNSLAHWLELELAKGLYRNIGDSLLLGAEMFERDEQILIDEYLNGLIKRKHFEKAASLWDNYETDYKPLLAFANRKGLDFVGTNIPRRYANFVAYNGSEALDTFGKKARRYLPPLPIQMNLESPAYQKIQKMGIHSKMEHMAEAQAVKDATMAWAIKQNRKSDETMLHFNGNFHSDNKCCIYRYLKQNNNDLEILTLSTVEQENVDTLKSKHQGKADFILAIPKDMTKSY